MSQIGIIYPRIARITLIFDLDEIDGVKTWMDRESGKRIRSTDVTDGVV